MSQELYFFSGFVSQWRLQKCATWLFLQENTCWAVVSVVNETTSVTPFRSAWAFKSRPWFSWAAPGHLGALRHFWPVQDFSNRQCFSRAGMLTNILLDLHHHLQALPGQPCFFLHLVSPTSIIFNKSLALLTLSQHLLPKGPYWHSSLISTIL